MNITRHGTLWSAINCEIVYDPFYNTWLTTTTPCTRLSLTCCFQPSFGCWDIGPPPSRWIGDWWTTWLVAILFEVVIYLRACMSHAYLMHKAWCIKCIVCSSSTQRDTLQFRNPMNKFNLLASERNCPPPLFQLAQIKFMNHNSC